MLHGWGRGPRWWGPDRPSPGSGWPFSPLQGGCCCTMITEPAGPVRFRAGLAKLAKIMTRISVLTRKGVLTQMCFTAAVSCGAGPASRASSFAFPLSPGSGRIRSLPADSRVRRPLCAARQLPGHLVRVPASVRVGLAPCVAHGEEPVPHPSPSESIRVVTVAIRAGPPTARSSASRKQARFHTRLLVLHGLPRGLGAVRVVPRLRLNPSPAQGGF